MEMKIFSLCDPKQFINPEKYCYRKARIVSVIDTTLIKEQYAVGNVLFQEMYIFLLQ